METEAIEINPDLQPLIVTENYRDLKPDRYRTANNQRPNHRPVL